ncbi:MAG: hypothetical protein DRP35_07850 [Candidatus Zixiibacteriota bacterium]|nr:MAG: hypothetical protein DRP35_07850 [candidate division Zixibacteria bacterium]
MFKKINILIFFLTITGYLTAQTCHANFTYSVDTTTNTVSFTDLSYTTDSSDFITSWLWDFGDGTSGSQQNETQTYVNGTYNVCLTITTTDSCSSTFCDSVFITNSINPCAGFYVTGIVSNESVSGANDGAIDITVSGGTQPFNYSWSDSSTIEDLLNLSAGQYCLTVTDLDACSYDTCFQVGIDSMIQCQADFSFSAGDCPNCFDFTDQSTATGAITDWFWDFGNSNYSTLQNPQQTFLDSGAFVVSLTITTSDSCSSTFTDTVYIIQSIQTFSVSGQVFVDTALLSSGTAELFSNNFSETHPPFYSVQIQNGSYFFPEVALGNYKLLAVPDAPESNNFQATFFGDKTAYGDAFVLAVYSNLVSVDIHLQPISNGMEKIKNGHIKISPNPFVNRFVIESQNQIQTVQIYSITGQLVFEKNNINTTVFSLQLNLPKGLFLLKIQQGQSVYFRKIIKN